MNVVIRQVSGPNLDDVFRTLRKLDKPLAKEVYAGMNRAVKPLTAAVKRSAAATLPRAGGYAQLMSRDVRVRANRRAATAIRLVTSARGKTEQRDVSRVDAGTLRHPVFKRYQRLKSGEKQARPWAATTVRPGFASRPMERDAPIVRRELLAALDRVMAKIP